jgi:copper(I)-binding protein
MKHALLAFALCATTFSASAQVSVDGAWIRATVPAQKSTGAFMQVTSVKAARLVGVSSTAAGSAEIHQMEMDGQMMKMRQVDGVDLAAGATVNMVSGGYHVMLMDLKRQLKAGDVVALTLVVEGKDKKRESIAVKVPVKPLAYAAPK